MEHEALKEELSQLLKNRLKTNHYVLSILFVFMPSM